MLNKSKELFEAWNRNLINYHHWKSNEHLVEGLDGDTDLDVLISPANKKEGCAILHEIGFKPFHSQFGSRYPNVEDWIGFDKETGRLLHLHLHFSLMTGHKGLKEYELPWREESLKTRILDEGTRVYIMNPNLELVTLYTRMILKSNGKTVRSAQKGSYKMDSHFLVEINYIKKRVEWRTVSEIANRYYGRHGEKFVELAKFKFLSSTQFLDLHKLVSSSMRKYSRYQGFSLSIRRSFYSNILRLRYVCFHCFKCKFLSRKVANTQKGLTIAFVGQDGSGKSTVTSDIIKWLTWKIDAQYFYLGSGDEHYYPWQKKMLKRASNSKHVWNKAFRSWLLLSYYLASAKYVLRTIKQANNYANKGGIAIFDRYPQISFFGINDGPKIRTQLIERVPQKLRWLAGWYAKKEEQYLERAVAIAPSLVFKLQLSPEESLHRKPEEKRETVIRKHEIVKALSFSSSKVYEIDAEQPYYDELLQIKKEIWQNISEL